MDGKEKNSTYIDYLIIGQGLCGTFISYFLLQAGQKILVIDDAKPGTASRVASGIINPVTGRRIVQTWRIEELLPFAMKAYADIGFELDASLVKQCSVLDFHPSLQMKEAFEKRLEEEPGYLHQAADFNWRQFFNYPFSIGEISPCLLIDINTMLSLWQQKLLSQNSFKNEVFNWNDCIVGEDHVTYKGIIAKKIICCNGISAATDPYFKNLPYSLNKGEAIIAKIDALPREHIYKQGINIVPWQDDLFWIGSSYEWNFADVYPTPSFKEKTVAQLKFWLKLPFEIVGHIASVRPANIERRPFVGLHPKHATVGILNGMGTKGCSLAPFFARQFAAHLVEGKPIDAEVDVKRFQRILERKMN